jgi:hypothetical protein
MNARLVRESNLSYSRPSRLRRRSIRSMMWPWPTVEVFLAQKMNEMSGVSQSSRLNPDIQSDSPSVPHPARVVESD